MNSKIKAWFAIFLTMLIVCFDPINRNITKLSFLLLFSVFVSYSLVIFWQKQIFRFLFLLIPVFIFLTIIIPGAAISQDDLKREYLSALKKYEGVKYLWGGESYFGIDCSGLLRKGMIDANLKLGLIKLNPRYLREAIDLWFFDIAADSMLVEYRQKTISLYPVKNLNEMNYSEILPGDFMVTDDGEHTMAYLGDKVWIEADPIKQEVIIVKAPEEKLPWFRVKAVILRWQQLHANNV